MPYHILLTSKNRFDWRVISGSFEPRYRPRLVLEKDMRTEYLYFTPSMYGEYYVYFNGGGLNRFRIYAGVQTKFTNHIEFETYYLHQFANGKKVKGLDAMGLVLKFYSKHKGDKKKAPNNKSQIPNKHQISKTQKASKDKTTKKWHALDIWNLFVPIAIGM